MGLGITLTRHAFPARFAGATDSRGDDDAGAAERAFNRLSMEERSSLKRETVVNVGGFRHTRDANRGGLTFDTRWGGAHLGTAMTQMACWVCIFLLFFNTRFEPPHLCLPPFSEEPQELVVVTLLLAARGHVELSPIKGRQELMDALRAAGAVREPDLMALEILWSPAEENDALSERELTLRYPHMVSL